MMSPIVLSVDAVDKVGNTTTYHLRMSNDAQAKRWMGLFTRKWPFSLMTLKGFRISDVGMTHGVETRKLIANIDAKTAHEKYGSFDLYNPSLFKASAYANYKAYEAREKVAQAERKAIELEYSFVKRK